MKVIALASLALTTYAKQSCSNGDNNSPTPLFCLNGTTIGDKTQFTIHSSEAGWAAIGTGLKMKDSNITLGFKDSTGKLQIGSFLGTGHIRPTPATSVVKAIDLLEPAPAWAKLSFSFEVPAVPSGPFIWAQSKTNAESLTSFTAHSAEGEFEALEIAVQAAPATATAAAPSPTAKSGAVSVAGKWASAAVFLVALL